MKPNIPSQKKAYNALNYRLVKYMAQVQSIYDRIATQVANAVDGVGYDGSVEFLFTNYPELNNTVNNVMSSYAAQMSNLIYSGTSSEWKLSNVMQDLLARKVLRAYDFEKGGDKYNRYFQPNSEALQAFQRRVDNGMNLSEKLWAQSQNLKRELEQTISTAIDKGQSAVVLSKRISKYLSDFPSLKVDYGEKFGKAVSCRDCQYASIRLARTEINMAYREAEQLRWQQFDFILGYEVKLSKKHPAPDICDDLKGKYPKDFKFVGWHPNCMCYVVPIVMDDSQYYGSDIARQRGVVVGTPKGFVDYMIKNDEKMRDYKNPPYFMRDNKQYMPFVMNDEISKILFNHDFNRINVSKYNASAIRGFNLEKFDSVLEKHFDEHEIRLFNKGVSIFDNGNVFLQYYGEHRNGEPFEMKRLFIRDSEGEIHVHHEYLEMPESVQGKGLGRVILEESYREYKRIGVKYLSLKANIDVGGYAWARYGFSSKVEDVEQALLHSNHASEELKEQALSVFKKWREANPNEGNFPMNIIAKEKYGKEILLGSHWNGILDLTDNKATSYFESYLGFNP